MGAQSVVDGLFGGDLRVFVVELTPDAARDHLEPLRFAVRSLAGVPATRTVSASRWSAGSVTRNAG